MTDRINHEGIQLQYATNFLLSKMYGIIEKYLTKLNF